MTGQEIKNPKREYQEAEGEGADDRQRDGDGGELYLADMADEDVGEGGDAVLADDVETNGSSDLPQLGGLHRKDSLHVA